MPFLAAEAVEIILRLTAQPAHPYNDDQDTGKFELRP